MGSEEAPARELWRCVVGRTAGGDLSLGDLTDKVLKSLTPREEKVLRLRFGPDDGRVRTLEVIGQDFRLTRERIRQIEGHALRKFRHPSRQKKLQQFALARLWQD